MWRDEGGPANNSKELSAAAFGSSAGWSLTSSPTDEVATGVSSGVRSDLCSLISDFLTGVSSGRAALVIIGGSTLSVFAVASPVRLATDGPAAGAIGSVCALGFSVLATGCSGPGSTGNAL